jgi:hypothetical protein
MKQLKRKLQSVVTRKKDDKSQSIGRITNETVAEHREQILAGGRRYKYPHQYARNSLIRNTVLISVGVIVLLLVLFWWQLYLAQNTSKFFYRVTQLIPVPVARIDGEFVSYEDYLMRLRSELHYLERESAINLNSTDGKRQTLYQKRVALNKAQDNAYISKIAKERGITVSNEEIDAFINQQLNSRKPSVSREEYEKIIRDYYDWSFNEYKEFIHEQLLRRKVALAIDDSARSKADEIKTQLQDGANFAKVAKSQSDDDTTKQTGGDVGFVSKNNDDPDGLIAAVQRLKEDEVSGVIETRSGYYIVKLLDTRENEVRYARILVSLKELDSRLATIRQDENKISEYIDVPKDVAPTRQE